MGRKLLLLIAVLLTALPALAEDEVSFVKLPLGEYTKLTDLARDPKRDPVPAPAGYALGTGQATVTVRQHERRYSADVTLTLSVQTLEDEWVAVPLLPAGTSVVEARADGGAVELISSPRGLLWSTNKKGTHQLMLHYAVDGARVDGAVSIAVPTPQAAGIALTAMIPATDIDAIVIPAAAIEQRPSGAVTSVTASIPGSGGFQILWRSRAQGGHALSRAVYRGSVEKNAVVFNADLTLDMQQDDPVSVKLLPQSAALRDLKVDDKPALIAVEGGFFTTSVSGRGTHKVTLEFQVSFDEDAQPRNVAVNIPEIPVSKFEIALPGKKELTVEPVSHVSHREENGKTIATAYVPMTSSVSMSWIEAVPEEVTKEVRASATIYHTAYAEEGVLYLKGTAVYEISRGETSVLSFAVPHGVQINRVAGPSDEVADWKVDQGSDGLDKVTVYLNREIKGEFRLDVTYDRSLAKEKEGGEVAIPLIRAGGVDRQRGMVALLSSKEVALKPVVENELTKVGENQLPADIRQGITLTVAHTYKYGDADASLVAAISKPEKAQGKFDASVGTLISLSDVTMKGAASIDVTVKSGAIEELAIELPKGVNFLSLTGPSIRNHKLNEKEGAPHVDVAFTQEMEGQFRLELAYERILSDTESDVDVPTVKVRGAEVEQGRIAVEALSAVEVQTASLAQLSTIDPSELPQQLVLKTSNPILLAFKYVHVSPPYHLALKITRHKELEVQEATIDRALYHTLITKDGVSVTSALFMVRNSRRQFLRIDLPAGSTVWSALVDGKNEKPARAGGSDRAPGSSILVKIINSAEPFPLQLVYQTPTARMGRFGFVRAALPRPDIPVTTSTWNLYLPDEYSYGRVDGSLNLISSARSSMSFLRDAQNAASELGLAAKSPIVLPPQLNVPASGRRFQFEKLYANQTAEEAWVSVPYSQGLGSVFVGALTAAGAVLAILGFAGLLGAGRSHHRARLLSFLGSGATLLGLLVGYLGVDHIAPLWLVAGGLAVILLARASRHLYQRAPLRGRLQKAPPPADDVDGAAQQESDGR